MNRIAGMVNLDFAPVQAQQIARMVEAQKYSLRDDEKLWAMGAVGLGCVQFVQGTAREGDDSLHSPLAQARYVITFDGRLDNRRELLAALRPQLVPDGRRFSEEELVLAAYDKWELDCPRHLSGDFAFAVWDMEKRRLVCVRDPFGVKPFYYALVGQGFVFASTPQALLASGRVPPVLREERIADFLVNPLEGVDKSSSFYAHVSRLPPAHMLVLENGGMRLERYWEVAPRLPGPLKSDDDYLEAFRELFTEAVRSRLQDLAVPASMLSGGMDSSAIVAAGRKVLAQGDRCLHALAVISRAPGANRETASISSVLAQGGVEPHLIAETELRQCMGALVGAIEREAEPFDCLMNLNRAVYLHARGQGCSALLDGIDGDVLLSGSGALLQLWRQAAFGDILGETLRAGGLTAEYKLGRRYLRDSLLSTLASFAPGWLRRARRRRRYRKSMEQAIRETIIDRDFAARSRLAERFAQLDAHSPQPPSLKQMDFHKMTLEHPFLTVGLERYERVASSFGIEARHPYTDVRLAEFCLALPAQWKTRHGWTKLILRRLMEGDLPQEVVWRKDKDSLMWEVNRLVLKERGAYFHQITLDEQSQLEPYVDIDKLMKFWQHYLTLGDETHADQLWSGAALAMWLRKHKNIPFMSF